MPSRRRADRHRLAGAGTAPADELVLVPRERESNRSAGRARELGGEQRLDTGALLPAEAAADELRDHAHALRYQVESPGELATGVEHALGRDPCSEPVSVPADDRRVRLERGLHVGGRLAGQLDAGVGRREGGVGVSANDLARLLGEALLRQPLVEEERRPFLELERQCDQACFGCVRRVRGDGGDGLARPGRLGRKRRVAAHRERSLRARAPP